MNDLYAVLYVVAICAAFAVIHSVTVSSRFKGWCGRTFGMTFMRAWYRLLYTVVSVVTAAIAVFLIAGVPDRTLVDLPGSLAWTMRFVQLVGLVFGVMAFEHLDGSEFLGIRQAWRYLRTRTVSGTIEGLTEKPLVTEGVYGVVRHPLYVAGIVIFSFSPIITVKGIALTVLADLYFLFGMFIEERRFLAIYGDAYREYMQRVPRMLPRVFK